MSPPRGRRPPGPQFGAILVATGLFAILFGVVLLVRGGGDGDAGSFKAVFAGTLNVSLGLAAIAIGARIIARSRGDH